MSLPAVLSAAVTVGAAIPGVGSAQAASPLPAVPWSEIQAGPQLYVSWDRTWTEVTISLGGAARWIEQQYGVLLTLYLGTAATTPTDAEATAAVYLDRFRAAYQPEPTLGGSCFEALLSGGQHNLDTYRAADEAPVCQWRLAVKELRQANTASAT